VYGACVSQTTRPSVGLATAAEALEAELSRFEDLVDALARERLESEKNLRRAAQNLVAIRDVDARLAERLGALVTAIGAARERQETSANVVRERAELIQQRSEALTALMQRWEALGQEAAEVTRIAQEAVSGEQESNGDEQAKPEATFARMDERLGNLAESAQGLATAAQEVAFEDLARQADGLRMQVLAARNKLRLARTTDGNA